MSGHRLRSNAASAAAAKQSPPDNVVARAVKRNPSATGTSSTSAALPAAEVVCSALAKKLVVGAPRPLHGRKARPRRRRRRPVR